MSQLLDAMFEKLVEAGEHIIDQDDDGDNFYVIERWDRQNCSGLVGRSVSAGQTQKPQC